MSIHWYAHHLGDYLQKTKHLRLVEHGAYRLLLDYYYSNGGPFKDDRKIIYRVCNAIERSERRAIDRILDQFFTISLPDDDRVWNHSRADQEIAKTNEISEIRRNSASKRYAKAGAIADTTYNHNHNKYINGFERKNGTSNGAHVEGFIISSSDQKRARMAGFKKTGIWRDEWGDKPKSN